MVIAKKNGIFSVHGPQGSGKTSLAKELVKRGYCAVDADKKLACYVNIETGEPTPFPAQNTIEFRRMHRWKWSIDKFSELCRSHKDEPIFISGGASNYYEFTKFFSCCFVLLVDEVEQRRRLIARKTKNAEKFEEKHGRNFCWISANKEIDDAIKFNRNFTEGKIKGIENTSVIFLRSDQGVERLCDQVLDHLSKSNARVDIAEELSLK